MRRQCGFCSWIYVLSYVYWFTYVELFPHLWDEAYFIREDDIFDVLFNSFWKYFIENFCVYVRQKHCSKIIQEKQFSYPIIFSGNIWTNNYWKVIGYSRKINYKTWV